MLSGVVKPVKQCDFIPNKNELIRHFVAVFSKRRRTIRMMRRTVTYIVLSLVTVGVFGGSFYGEKENALKAVVNKYKEFIEFAVSMAKRINDEKENTAAETEHQVRDTLFQQIDEQISEFVEKNYNVGAIAIAKGKPLSVIDCLKEVQLEGYYTFLQTMDDILNELNENIKERKESSLKTVLYNARLIATSTIILAEKLVEDIENATSGFQDLKADAIKKIETAKKLLEELEIFIPVPDLKYEFLSVGREIVPKVHNVTDIYVYKSYQCLLKF